MRKFTLEELRSFNGSQGRPVFIAYKGKVYDVSGSQHWQQGIHQDAHLAGRDVTAEIEGAPHGEEMLERFPVVGELEAAPLPKRRLWTPSLSDFVNRWHPHPILVDFPIALLVVSPLLLLLFLLTGEASLERAAYYLLVIGTLAAPLAIGAGLLSWWVNYHHTLTPIFRRKGELSALLLVVSSLCSLWRTFNPDIVVEGTYLSWLYLALILALSLIVIALGYYGGRLTFPGR